MDGHDEQSRRAKDGVRGAAAVRVSIDCEMRGGRCAVDLRAATTGNEPYDAGANGLFVISCWRGTAPRLNDADRIAKVFRAATIGRQPGPLGIPTDREQTFAETRTL